LILSLDVSTSCVGIAVIDENENIVVSEAIKLSSKDSLEYRCFIFKKKLKEINEQYDIEHIYVEAPLMNGPNQKTVCVLQRFNGMICFCCLLVFGFEPVLISASTARKLVGIKKASSTIKEAVISFVEKKYKNSFRYERTPKGNPTPGTDDRADAIVVALAGLTSKRRGPAGSSAAF
jgi:Holliday junction resolvasome RuvABC endonuclease subunit